ncbi:unnamed protein product [Vitrella brassicaformis CCMP3155]|uniref:Protein DPCD n=2 Tax=Vitrella brassicaformis TaxID=1169539 RepID=A0A0G4ENE6_VITBC|nr:unnamed protein product [Vitrella brassicaformis CCMP3155]|eukprot:CEL99362.1 unnamed protein product [Vitrella brassicaformis CCMP3155]
MTSADEDPEKVAFIKDSRRIFHIQWKDGREMVEEYDAKTDELLVRKVRQKSRLGAEGKWEYEIGMPPSRPPAETELLVPSSNNPIFSRKDTQDCFQWRIRNLSFPSDVFSLSIDDETQQILVKTSNKKYYKRISVPDLARVSLPLDPSRLEWKHMHNTLIISYRKPTEVRMMEARHRREAKERTVKVPPMFEEMAKALKQH